MYETLAKVMSSANDTLKLRRDTCGHKSAFSRRDAFALYGQHATAYMIRRCSKYILCGERARIIVTI